MCEYLWQHISTLPFWGQMDKVVHLLLLAHSEHSKTHCHWALVALYWPELLLIVMTLIFSYQNKLNCKNKQQNAFYSSYGNIATKRIDFCLIALRTSLPNSLHA